MTKGELKLRYAINQASAHNIPAGRVPQFNPNHTEEISQLIEERYQTKATIPPTAETISKIAERNAKIRKKLDEQKTANFNEFVSSTNRRTKLKEYWRKVRAIFHSKDPEPNPPPKITLDGKVPTQKETATKLVCYYSDISKGNTSKEHRQIARIMRNSKTSKDKTKPFSKGDVRNAIKNSKNTAAVGPDGISIYHLRHLGDRGLTLLTEIFNQSWLQNKIPFIWKKGHIIPILKPGKPPSEAASFRPITILCAPSKVLERLMLDRNQPYIMPENHQHMLVVAIWL